MTLRHRLAALVSRRPPPAVEPEAPDMPVIEALCRAQTAPWRGRRFRKAAFRAALHDLAAARVGTFLIEIGGGDVLLHPKAGFETDGSAEPHELVRRARIYRDFLERAVRTAPDLGHDRLLAVSVEDEAPDDAEMPLFSFQKRRGQRNILLPDFQLIADGRPRDPFGFDEKTTTAAFAGSTTGRCPITLEDLARDSVPRIRAARVFRGSDKVSFELTSIVQCASPEVEAALRAEGFGAGRVGWMEKGFRSKFLLSIDGNGAACSRLAVALFSNSAVVAYESPHTLFYSDAMVAWLHYVPVQSDTEVLAVVDAEADDPGLHAPIAAAGRSFARGIMSTPALLAYTAALLRHTRKMIAD